MSVEILAGIERDLRQLTGDSRWSWPTGSTSPVGPGTGAIIAACIACGMSVGEIRRFYLESGEEMFDKASLLKRLRYSYNDEPLARKLQSELDRALVIGQRPAGRMRYWAKRGCARC